MVELFTGIIEEIGTLRQITRQGNGMVLTVEAKLVLQDVHLGDSIAVNGVCLTVVAFDKRTMQLDVTPETYRETTLGSYRIGEQLNLERAMAAGGRFGGHMVQGHVDATGVIQSRYAEDNAIIFTIAPKDESIMRYIVSRGSITIDGISLTIIRVTDHTFSVSIIPHTLTQTILQHKEAGATVNLETDIIGRYIERLLHFQQGEAGADTALGDYTAKRKARTTSGMTEQFLADHGFM